MPCRMLKALKTLDSGSVFHRPSVRGVSPSPHPSPSRGEGVIIPSPLRGGPGRGNCKGRHSQTLLLLFCCLSLLPTASVLAQGGVGVGGDRPSAKTRRFPFKVVVTGFLNTDPAPDALAVIQLGVTGYRGDFQLEVTNVTAPDSPQLTPRQIFLHRAGKRKADLDVTGPRDTLAKIAQAQPGTPLELTGWYAQRDGEFRLENVRIVGFE